MSKPPHLILGMLPVEIINKTLGMELDPGSAVLSRAAQAHAFKRHPNEYGLLLPHVASVVLDPLYIGDDHNNPDRIELIRMVPVITMSPMVLVTVNVVPDADGSYHVTSFYPVSKGKIEGRRDRGFLKTAVKP